MEKEYFACESCNTLRLEGGAPVLVDRSEFESCGVSWDSEEEAYRAFSTSCGHWGGRIAEWGELYTTHPGECTRCNPRTQLLMMP